MRIESRRIALLLLLAVAAATLPAAAAGAPKGQVNINKAGVEQLSLLPRVGPAIAQRIVEFREQNGDFKAAEDLMLVRGIGEKTFELLKPYLTLSGETTLSEKVSSREAAPEQGDGD